MKTAVSLPDDLFHEADATAKALGKTGSQLHREAIANNLLRHEPGAMTAAMNAALAEIDQTPDPWFVEARRRGLERVEW